MFQLQKAVKIPKYPQNIINRSSEEYSFTNVNSNIGFDKIKTSNISDNESYCTKCGSKVFDADIFCLNCGNKVG
jgi:hypothetical protein